MATTDSRPGFRLPWSTDRSASREASAEPADSLEASVIANDIDTGAVVAPEPNSTSDQDASGNAAAGDEEEHVTILAPDAAPHSAQDGATAMAPKVTEAGVTSGSDPVAVAAPAAAPAPTPIRRPTKFLADLTRAMQVAAEQARTGTLDQFRADGTAVMEQIHAGSASGAAELRQRADEDVAAIKDWSKAEIARIREETERRVGSRREQLEGQLERHAALVEHEIEKIRGRVAAFEDEMGRFFDQLLTEDDPAVFAARAASLPEPPSFGDLDSDALSSLLHEPGLGVPEAAEPVAEASVAEADVVIEPEPVAGAVETQQDREAAMAAIQAAAEAAAALEAAGPPAEAEDASAAADAVVTAEAETSVEPVESVADGAEAPVEGAAEPVAETAPEVDPRLAMLGLTSDFEAAEVAAAEAAASELDEVPVIDDEALAARLSGLVPDESQAPASPTITTQVVVTGLVSVASIASFKRHLGRLAGVGHVGVSSGPDGEFVFAVAHDPATSVRELIPTVPGFGARVVGSGDGIVHVSAQDPQD